MLLLWWSNVPVVFVFRYGTLRQAQSDRLLSSLGETARTTVTIPASFVRPSGTSQVPAEVLAPAAVGEGGGNRGGSSGASFSSMESSGRSDRSGFLLSRCVIGSFNFIIISEYVIETQECFFSNWFSNLELLYSAFYGVSAYAHILYIPIVNQLLYLIACLLLLHWCQSTTIIGTLTLQ